VTLETEIKKGFEKKAELLNGKDVTKKILEIDEALNTGKAATIAEAGVALTVASLCSGFLLNTQAGPAPRASQPTESILKDAAVEVNAVIRDAKFPVGSAELSHEIRQYIELRLAVHRKLVEYPGWMDIEGLASPEWSNLGRTAAAQKNIDLSLHRANAVRDAIFDAAGAPGQGILPDDKDIDIQGKGSQPFDADFSNNPGPGQHLSVFSPLPTDPAQAQQVQADREKFLPSLRRVDIAMNGVFTLRIPAS